MQWYFYNYRIIRILYKFCFPEIWPSFLGGWRQKERCSKFHSILFQRLFSFSLNFRGFISPLDVERVRYYLANCPNKLNFPSFRDLYEYVSFSHGNRVAPLHYINTLLLYLLLLYFSLNILLSFLFLKNLFNIILKNIIISRNDRWNVYSSKNNLITYNLYICILEF